MVLDSGPLTVGKLITFQLYWNMIRQSYGGSTFLLLCLARFVLSPHRELAVLWTLESLPSGRDVRLSARAWQVGLTTS